MSANATGTPTTTFSVPKFNTASDAPNGRGVNEMMDALDVVLASVRGTGFVSSAPSDADVPVWDVASSRWRPSSAKTPSLPSIGSVPTGAIIQYGVASAPGGWTLADGSAISRTGASAALFAVFGTLYGIGDNSTTFNVPDLRGRVPVGYAASGGHSDVATLANNEGTAAASRRPKHPHSNSLGFAGSGGTTSGQSASHTHSIAIEGGTGVSVARWGDAVGGGVTFNSGAASGDHTHTITPAGTITGAVGAAGTANDAPAYIVVNFIIKL